MLSWFQSLSQSLPFPFSFFPLKKKDEGIKQKQSLWLLECLIEIASSPKSTTYCFTFKLFLSLLTKNVWSKKKRESRQKLAMIALSHLNKFDSNLIWYNELLVEAVLLSKSKESVPLVKKMIESQSSKIGFLLSDVLLAIGETETDSASQEEFENFIIFNKLNESYLQGNSLFRERRHGEVQVHFFRFLFLFSNSKRSNFKVFSVWRKLFEAVEKTENWKLLLYVCRKQKEFLEKESNEISKAFLSKVNSSITETISKLNYVDIFSKGSPAVSSTKKRSQDKENKESKERREERRDRENWFSGGAHSRTVGDGKR